MPHARLSHDLRRSGACPASGRPHAMKRLCILAFCMSALAVAQQPAKAAPTAALRWITNTLANTRATVYTSDRHDTFVRDAYFYTDVRFTDPCHLLYVEHRNVATANRVQHDIARASWDLHDLAAQQTHVVRYSEQHPAPP